MDIVPCGTNIVVVHVCISSVCAGTTCISKSATLIQYTWLLEKTIRLLLHLLAHKSVHPLDVHYPPPKWHYIPIFRTSTLHTNWRKNVPSSSLYKKSLSLCRHPKYRIFSPLAPDSTAVRPMITADTSINLLDITVHCRTIICSGDSQEGSQQELI